MVLPGFGTTAPLPLDIIWFKGKAGTNDIVLDREVALEKNVKEFIVVPRNLSPAYTVRWIKNRCRTIIITVFFTGL